MYSNFEILRVPKSLSHLPEDVWNWGKSERELIILFV